MTLVVTLWVITALLELGLYVVPQIWQSKLNRRFIAALIVPLLAGSLSGLIALTPGVWTILIGFVGLYRIINILRVAEGRISDAHLRRVAPLTSALLLGSQIILALLWLLTPLTNLGWASALTGLAVLQLATAIVISVATTRTLRRTSIPHRQVYNSDDLPSVTLAIPARNETRDLEACLKAATHSNYPKLEILVLDDCSQFRRTPEIIREFAHDGVRFVKGEPPRDGWLAKNQAYNQLTREASGKLILYIGVDVRLQPDTITRLVTELLETEKRMLCVMPMRFDQKGLQFSIVQAARYAWELSLPRRLFNRPPVLSSCWLAYRSDIKKFGGFAAVSRAITPEAYFARRSIEGDGYRFARSSALLGVYSAKSPTDQRATMLRTRYPSVRRRPEMVALNSAFQLLCLLGAPFVALLGVIGFVPVVPAFMAAIATLLCFSAYVRITGGSRIVSWQLAPLAAPLSVLADIYLLNLSMWRYEFSEVVWKGRNVCLPVMHVEKSLPKF